MGTDIFFFTDVDLLNGQTPEQAFGPVSNTISQFRVVNTFTVLDKANIYAICRGKKLTYQDGTVILYPYDETIFDGLPVQYFIYTNVDVSNVVTQLIPEDESDDLLIAQQYKYSAYLESVEAGAIIAETYDNTVSIAVVTTGVDDGLRAFEKYVDCVTINGGENSKRQREKILSYMDISAFYGMFVGDKIKVKKNTGGGTVYKSQEEIYNYILSKFWNRNKIYVDIRDSRYYSLNYRKNEETQHCIEVQGNISSNVEYETFPQWPLLIIEEPKDSNNADPLSLKYYEAIVQISNGRKTYCVFGYKRKGKRLKKQRLYNTSKISISFPVVNGNYVSSYYRYMVDTDITNQEGLNGLFQVRPFEEYTRYYNSSAEVQSWLTGRLCFYENDVVACGIALDYGKDRITFWSVPINNPSTRIDRCVIKTNDDESFFQVFYNKRKKEPELICRKYNISNENSVNNTLCIPMYIAHSEYIVPEIVSISLRKTEFEFIFCDDITFMDHFIWIISINKKRDLFDNNVEFWETEISIFPQIRIKTIIYCEKQQRYNNWFTQFAGENEKCAIEYFAKEGGVEYLKNTEDKYEKVINKNDTNNDVNKTKIDVNDEIENEKVELQNAYKDIEEIFPSLYYKINKIIYIGIPLIYPDGTIKRYRPKLILKFEYLENKYSGSFSIDPSNDYESGTFKEKEHLTENDRLIDISDFVLDEYKLFVNNFLMQQNAYIDIENVDNTRWIKKCKIKNGDDWKEISFIDAIKQGRAVLKESLTIRIALEKRCSYACDINDSLRRYKKRSVFVASTLCHELGHLYYRVNNMLECYLMKRIEDQLGKIDVIRTLYPYYSNPQNTEGHILGDKSGIMAVKEEINYYKKINQNFCHLIRSYPGEYTGKILSLKKLKKDVKNLEEKLQDNIKESTKITIENEIQQKKKHILNLLYIDSQKYCDSYYINNIKDVINEYKYNANHLINMENEYL